MKAKSENLADARKDYNTVSNQRQGDLFMNLASKSLMISRFLRIAPNSITIPTAF
jgi:hypothetical protein